MEDDSVKLLRECNAGIKMGISSLDDVMDNVQNTNLREVLAESRDTHCRLGNETHEYLTKYHDDGKEPALMAKAMAKVKSNFQAMSDNPDASVASMITDGCNMGIKSLYRYLNQYPAADKPIKNLANDIIKTEDKLRESLRPYL